MIIRVVHMFFKEEEVPAFLTIFESSAEKIRSFEGCQGLELWENKTIKGGFTTYSFWENEADLEKYRKSELFAKTWKATKLLFAEKPIAFSFEQTRFVLK